MSQFKKVAPGVAVAIIIACCAQFLESLLPIHLIGASVIALFIGMLINTLVDTSVLKAGLKFTSKKILKFAIILLGASLNIQTILTVGSMSLAVMCFTLLTCFGGGFFIGKALGLDWKLSNLISAGTGICGGSAIAAIAPVIDAEDMDIAYAMSATFIFDMIMILAFPFMGHFLGLSDMAYGLWAGTAVNDTSSVVAAGYAYTEAAGDFATMVKLTRTLAIIPTVLAFAYVNIRVQQKEGVRRSQVLAEVNAKGQKYEVSQLDKMEVLSKGSGIQPEKATSKVNFLSIFPWFILGFVALAIINSFGVIPVGVSGTAKDISKFLMVAALAAIGLNTNVKDMKKSGIAPMLHGFIISALVVIVAITVEYFMGIV
ncbi:YeiH family protein [Chakrabartyella piscis]|uniref:YeiH family protein n=1 Tax=Chakrabartyella piscis TaxID=2918914 RepID=UPI002958AC8E|nr:putative sulfate exporter family transporter [Chakrabartyella piscis]